MDQIKLKIKKQVSDTTDRKIDALAELWQQLFEADIGCNHLEKLVEHHDEFFNEVICETQDRKNAIKKRIACLLGEKNELKSLLKEDPEDVPSDVPLYTLQMNIEKSLESLREKLKSEGPLVADPLPSEAEMQRNKKIKRDNMRKLIENVRVEIEEYWGKCLKSDAERLRFPSYTAKTFNEDVLELHEDELRDLKTFYEENEAIFDIIKERQDLWTQMESLQSKESDPKRYNNRGAQLLKEEKERKMLSLKLPKIEAKLIGLVEKFEQEHNRPFTMYGIRIRSTDNRATDRRSRMKRSENLLSRKFM